MGTKKTDLLREVVRADPDYWKDKTNEVEYVFGNNRVFKGNSAKRGPYAPPPEPPE